MFIINKTTQEKLADKKKPQLATHSQNYAQSGLFKIVSNSKTRAAFNPSQSQGLADDALALSIEPASAQFAVFVYALSTYLSRSFPSWM